MEQKTKCNMKEVSHSDKPFITNSAAVLSSIERFSIF